MIWFVEGRRVEFYMEIDSIWHLSNQRIKLITRYIYIYILGAAVTRESENWVISHASSSSTSRSWAGQRRLCIVRVLINTHTHILNYYKFYGVVSTLDSKKELFKFMIDYLIY